MARKIDCENTLGVRWSKKENDFDIFYPNKPDGFFMYDFMCNPLFKEFVRELDERGYDIKTLEIKVKTKSTDELG